MSWFEYPIAYKGKVMAKHVLVSFLILIGASPVLLVAEDLGSIVVNVSGFKTDAGKTFVRLFNNENGFPEKPENAYKSGESKIKNNTATVKFENVPFATYSVSVVHDENDNGKLDTNIIGIPKEGIGTSNNVKPKFGAPKFKDAKFDLESKNVELDISVMY